MAKLVIMDDSASSAPPPIALPSVTATEAKNSFGSVLDRVMVEGRVAITKHEEVRAVLLSVAEYRSLLKQQYDPLAALGNEFDGLVERMNAPKARAAGRALFEATPARLGRAAKAAAKSRR
jgi:prevent-host-death family protein